MNEIKNHIWNPIKKQLIRLSYLPEKVMLQLYYDAADHKYPFPDKLFQKWDCKIHGVKKIDLHNPRTYQDKLQWLKLYNRNPCYTKMVDKYEVRKFISDVISEDILIPCFGVYNKWEDIDFDSLPNEFVIKCTHDSGSVVICKDKSNFDFIGAKQKIEKGLRTNHFYKSREWPYKNVKPRIVIEKLLKDNKQEILNDYKVYCFNGLPKMILICSERSNKNGYFCNYYDMNWNELEISNEKGNTRIQEKPENFDRMVEYSRIISKDIPFLRVDYYEVNGKLYFGETTFFSGGGRHPWKSHEIDLMLGSWIDLPHKKR